MKYQVNALKSKKEYPVNTDLSNSYPESKYFLTIHLPLKPDGASLVLLITSFLTFKFSESVYVYNKSYISENRLTHCWRRKEMKKKVKRPFRLMWG